MEQQVGFKIFAIDDASPTLEKLRTNLDKTVGSTSKLTDRLTTFNERTLVSKIGITALAFATVRYIDSAEEMAEKLENLSPALIKAKKDLDNYRSAVDDVKESVGKMALQVGGATANLIIWASGTKWIIEMNRELERSINAANEAQKRQIELNNEMHQGWLVSLNSVENFIEGLKRKQQIESLSNDTDKLRLELTFKLQDSLKGLESNQEAYNQKLKEGTDQINKYIESTKRQSEAMQEINRWTVANMSQYGTSGSRAPDLSHLDSSQLAAVKHNLAGGQSQSNTQSKQS